MARSPSPLQAAPIIEADGVQDPVDTRDRLKLAARRLFARRGIDGVAVRDIVAASGQRNAASIFYYFGTKEALVRELVVDGARRIDERRNAALDELEAQPMQPRLRQIIDTLVRTSYPAAGEGPDEQAYLRFIATLQSQHRDLFLDALGERWNHGHKRVLEHIRRLLPQLPAAILNQRLVFMSVYVSSVLAAREAVLDDPGRKNSSLRGTFAIENLVDTIEAMLSAAPAPATMSALAEEPVSRVRTRAGTRKSIS